MMKANLRMTNPDDAECTVTITMPLKDWKRLRDQLTNTSGYPSWKVAAIVEQLVGKATQHLHYEEEHQG